MDELRKKLGETPIPFDWEKFVDRVNPVLSLIKSGKIDDNNCSRFWILYDSVLNAVSESHVSFVTSSMTLGAFCEFISTEQSSRRPKEYKIREDDFIYQVEEPIHNYRQSIIIDESSRIKRMLLDVYKDNSTLLKLESREFEEVIAELLSKQGFKVELTQRTKDGGYDIIALLNYNFHNPIKFLVECKRYSKMKVGVEVIRSFKHVIDKASVNRGIFVTTSYFTKGALDEQKEYPYLLDYRDKDKVLDWVKGYFNNII